MEDNRSRRERRALATRAIEPAQLGLAGAAQLGCLHRQSGKDAEPEVEYLVTSRVAGKLCPEEFLTTDRQYWGVESGLHQRLDCSGFEDRLRVRHKGAVHILGLFARVGVALFVRWAQKPAPCPRPNFSHLAGMELRPSLAYDSPGGGLSPGCAPIPAALTNGRVLAERYRLHLRARVTPFCSPLTRLLPLTKSRPTEWLTLCAALKRTTFLESAIPPRSGNDILVALHWYALIPLCG